MRISYNLVLIEYYLKMHNEQKQYTNRKYYDKRIYCINKRTCCCGWHHIPFGRLHHAEYNSSQWTMMRRLSLQWGCCNLRCSGLLWFMCNKLGSSYSFTQNPASLHKPFTFNFYTSAWLMNIWQHYQIFCGKYKFKISFLLCMCSLCSSTAVRYNRELGFSNFHPWSPCGMQHSRYCPICRKLVSVHLLRHSPAAHYWCQLSIEMY